MDILDIYGHLGVWVIGWMGGLICGSMGYLNHLSPLRGYFFLLFDLDKTMTFMYLKLQWSTSNRAIYYEILDLLVCTYRFLR